MFTEKYEEEIMTVEGAINHLIRTYGLQELIGDQAIHGRIMQILVDEDLRLQSDLKGGSDDE